MTNDVRVQPVGEMLARLAERVEADLERWIVEPDTPAPLADAMRYCVLGGGKRLRPGLVVLAGEACGGDRTDEAIRRAAVAIELVHAYSLVHDDLPAMDDDAVRRGKPTAHVRYGQAMAILAGDALLTRAFGVLGELDRPVAGALVAELAHAGGCSGMVAGQVADMDLCPIPAGLAGLDYIHARKTAALLRAAARLGALAAAAEPHALAAVSTYGLHLGLAFQLVDDLLDATGSPDEVGKATGKDAAAGKRTHVAIVGLPRARELARELTDGAIRALAPLGDRALALRRLAESLTERTR